MSPKSIIANAFCTFKWNSTLKENRPFWIHLLQSNVMNYFAICWGQSGTYRFASIPFRIQAAAQRMRVFSSPLSCPVACAYLPICFCTSRVSSTSSIGCSDPSPHWCVLASSIPYLVLAATTTLQRLFDFFFFFPLEIRVALVLSTRNTNAGCYSSHSSCCTPLKQSKNNYFTKKSPYEHKN